MRKLMTSVDPCAEAAARNPGLQRQPDPATATRVPVMQRTAKLDA